MTKRIQLSYIHTLNYLQHGVCLRMGPFDELNFLTFSNVNMNKNIISSAFSRRHEKYSEFIHNFLDDKTNLYIPHDASKIVNTKKSFHSIFCRISKENFINHLIKVDKKVNHQKNIMDSRIEMSHVFWVNLKDEKHDPHSLIDKISITEFFVCLVIKICPVEIIKLKIQ